MGVAATAAIIGAGVAITGAIAAEADRKNPEYKDQPQQDILNKMENTKADTRGSKAAYSALQNTEALRGQSVALNNSQQDLATLLQQMSQTGGLPGQQDISAAQTYAQNQFAPQQVAMQQAFESQLTDARRQAALSGRSQNDPILRAKLAQEQTRQSALLQAQQGAFAGQVAMTLPERRLQFAEGRTNVLANALQQRQAFERNAFGLGLEQQNADLAVTAQRLGNLGNQLGAQQTIAAGKYQEQKDFVSKGQQFQNIMNAGIAGMGAGMSAGSAMGGGGGGGFGGGSFAPQLSQPSFGSALQGNSGSRLSLGNYGQGSGSNFFGMGG